MSMANDNGPRRLDGMYDEHTTAMLAAIVSAKCVCALFHEPEDWQAFYDREGGPLPFARARFARLNVDPDISESAVNVFLSTFLAEHTRVGSPRIHRKGMPLIGHALYGFEKEARGWL